MLAELKSFARKNLGSGGVSFLKDFRSKYRKLKRNLSKPVTEQKIVQQLRAAGINEGDTIIVHSSFGRMGNVTGGPETVIAALKKSVGNTGTVVMPAYAGLSNFNNSMETGKLIDLREEKSQQGAISETFRKSAGVKRSSHPFSSCCAWGKNAYFITSGHEQDERICHKDSPLARAMELNAKVIGIGVDMGPISFYHVVEDTWDGFPVQVYSEAVQAKYIDSSGKVVERKVKFYKPELSNVRIDSDNNLWVRRRMTSELDNSKVRKKFTIGTGPGWCINSKDFYGVIKRLAKDQQITIYTMGT